MAATATATATATGTASSDTGEGPVMGIINKRLRALRKKYNRITQMEESISQGKSLNKEQQDVLRSKPSVVILIEELEKLRTPLSVALSEEISLATQHHQASSDQTTAPDQKEVENNVADIPEEASSVGGAKLEDLVNLLYFGSLFDVKSQNELASIMLTRTHERGCCLVYDTVTDESTDLLCDRDLDSISELWTMMISRPVDSSLSHKNALERCIEHAKLWLANSDQPIASHCNVSYAALREKLKKIMGSNYFTITPEMRAPVEATAAAANYGSFQLAGDNEQKEEDASNRKEEESVVNDQFEQPNDESVTEGEVVHGQQEQAYTQVEGGKSKRDYQQQYVPRGSHQNQRGHRGARRGHSNARGTRGGGGYSNGRYDSYDNSGGNGYQRNYYNNRGRGRGGGGNGHSYNNHQDSNVTVAS